MPNSNLYAQLMKNLLNHIILLTSIVLGQLSISYDVEASPIDQKLQKYIKTFVISSPKTVPGKGTDKYQFGKMLFEDKDLSVSKNISCMSCHNPILGSSDGLPFSIGSGGVHNGLKSKQLNAKLTSRSSPHLYNKGHSSFRTMFWDGRVFYDEFEDSFETPEPGLSGKSPLFNDIVEKIENVMSMQALFPIASSVEMRGEAFKSITNREVWRIISKRIVNKPTYKKYITDDFNIADIANALSFFQKIEFQVNDTPFDKYIAGNLDTLSSKEKDGAVIFFEKGRCSRCHHGVLLSNQAFQGAGVPQIGPGHTKDQNDEGRFLITGREFQKYGFLTQPLRNIALTAPFMHDGALKDLKTVVLHYNNPSRSIDDYSVLELQNLYGSIFNDFIYVDKNPYRNIYRKQAIAPQLRRPLGLNNAEVNSLVCFLKKSLTQEKFHFQLSFNECN
jgi:cytochrome c peroxidase